MFECTPTAADPLTIRHAITIKLLADTRLRITFCVHRVADKTIEGIADRERYAGSSGDEEDPMQVIICLAHAHACMPAWLLHPSDCADYHCMVLCIAEILHCRKQLGAAKLCRNVWA